MATADQNPTSTLTVELPVAAAFPVAVEIPEPRPVESRAYSLLGVRITDLARQRALALVVQPIAR